MKYRSLLALAVILLCSCRGPHHPSAGPGALGGAPCPPLPPQALAGTLAMPGGMGQPPFGALGVPDPAPRPVAVTGPAPWAPEEVARPWPADEYLRDGADAGTPAGLTTEGIPVGVEPEDAIAYGTTVAGRVIVEPTNRVHIYSPRFLAVRQVSGVQVDEQMNRTAGVVTPESLVAEERIQLTGTTKQNVQARRDTIDNRLTILAGRQGQEELSSNLVPQAFQDAFQPYENYQVLRTGQFDQTEAAFVARGEAAAVTWRHVRAVQVFLNRQSANALVNKQPAGELFVVDEPPARPKLRVIKVASTQWAQPGETVDFTIRFDNVGNQPIGNVTIVDNLTTRLAYVPQSAQSSLKARFTTHESQSESLVLRWDFADPLPAGKGGVVRFTCRVR